MSAADRPSDWLLRLLASALLLWGLSAGAQVPMGQEPSQAVLRLSWKTPGERIRVAVPQDPNLPAHMRLPDSQAFETRIAPYRLRVLVDGSVRLDRRVEASGIHHDRPLNVYEEVPLPPGEVRVAVDFRPDPEAQATVYNLEVPVTLRAGRVALVGLDPQTRRLVLSCP